MVAVNLAKNVTRRLPGSLSSSSQPLFILAIQSMYNYSKKVAPDGKPPQFLTWLTPADSRLKVTTNCVCYKRVVPRETTGVDLSEFLVQVVFLFYCSLCIVSHVFSSLC